VWLPAEVAFVAGEVAFVWEQPRAVLTCHQRSPLRDGNVHALQWFPYRNRSHGHLIGFPVCSQLESNSAPPSHQACRRGCSACAGLCTVARGVVRPVVALVAALPAVSNEARAPYWRVSSSPAITRTG
jgi:hypothetical protein